MNKKQKTKLIKKMDKLVVLMGRIYIFLLMGIIMILGSTKLLYKYISLVNADSSLSIFCVCSFIAGLLFFVSGVNSLEGVKS